MAQVAQPGPSSASAPRAEKGVWLCVHCALQLSGKSRSAAEHPLVLWPNSVARIEHLAASWSSKGKS